ncbi:MAG: hypothetical protein OXI95_07155 [bacterium]|nr:hypothetical protein [bacterium]MDE0416699.1 hypothetical protein [bacterium]
MSGRTRRARAETVFEPLRGFQVELWEAHSNFSTAAVVATGDVTSGGGTPERPGHGLAFTEKAMKEVCIA